MYAQLKEINKKPKAFEFYTADALWADEYRSKQMLKYHLDPEIDVASRNKQFIERSVEWIVANFSVNDKTKLCDFGCAVGFYTSALAKTGAEVTGIDFSKSSIEYAEKTARKEALSIRYVHQNYLDYQTGEKYDLITMIMCDFCALSPLQRKHLLDKFRMLLNDGGAVLLDVYALAGYRNREENATYEHNQLNHFWSANDYYGFLNTFKYEEEKVVLDKYTIIEKQEKYVIYNWLQYYSIEMLKTEFEASGLTINAIYDDVAGSAYSGNHTEFAVMAMKSEKY